VSVSVVVSTVKSGDEPPPPPAAIWSLHWLILAGNKPGRRAVARASRTKPLRRNPLPTGPNRADRNTLKIEMIIMAPGGPLRFHHGTLLEPKRRG
jgi:hypothetical protein